MRQRALALVALLVSPWSWLARHLARMERFLRETPRSPVAVRLQRAVPGRCRIGVAVLVHERPDQLRLCLDTLFRTRLYGYDVTFLLLDDGSRDPEVRRILERPRDRQYRVVRSYTEKGHDSWGAAFNKAMRQLLAMGEFDVLGSCDSDAVFHPEWLSQLMAICLWAKQNHREHILGPFSAFNSSDADFHGIIGTYSSPHGQYVIKRRMGALTYFFLRQDLLRLGFFPEDRDDETLMTNHYQRLGVRSFCTQTSYVEHNGQMSVLNQWRPTPVRAAVHGMNLTPSGWGPELAMADTLGYYRYVRENASFGPDVRSETKVDVFMAVVGKDLPVLPFSLRSIREFLRHPIGRLVVVAPDDTGIRTVCRDMGCEYVAEDSVLPFRREDIHYVCSGVDRSGWLYKQLMILYSDAVCTEASMYVLDADTVLVCPQVFEVGGQTVLLHSDEHHHPYYACYARLFGAAAPTVLSFVAHQMLFRATRLQEMRHTIEARHARPWWQAILSSADMSDASCFSEYETYGHWLMQTHPAEVRREYWFNVAVPRGRLRGADWERSKEPCRSVSCHAHA